MKHIRQKSSLLKKTELKSQLLSFHTKPTIYDQNKVSLNEERLWLNYFTMVEKKLRKIMIFMFLEKMSSQFKWHLTKNDWLCARWQHLTMTKQKQLQLSLVRFKKTRYKRYYQIGTHVLREIIQWKYSRVFYPSKSNDARIYL